MRNAYPIRKAFHAIAIMLAAMMATPLLAADAAQPVKLKPLRLDLTITRDGKVTDLRCPADYNAAICQGAMKGVSAWNFTPGQRGNEATDMQIRLVLSLEAMPAANAFQLKVREANVFLPAPANPSEAWMEARRRAKPVYPPHEQMKGVTGLVTIELWVQPDSKLPRVGQTWFNHGNPGQRNRLVDAATAAARQWPLDSLAPEQKSTCMNVEFSLDMPLLDTGTAPCQPTFVEGFALPALPAGIRNSTL